MTRQPGLIALTRRRAATPRSAAAVIVVLTLLAAFLIAAAPRALTGVVQNEVAFQVDGLSAASRDVSALVRGVPDDFGPATDAAPEGWEPGADPVFGALAQRLGEIRAGANASVRNVLGDAAFFTTTDEMEVTPDVLPPTSPTGLIQFVADPVYREHLTLTDGTWPAPWSGTGPIPVVLTRDAAEQIVWAIGEERALGQQASVVLVGLVAPVEATADRWGHHPPTVLTGTLFDDGNSRPRAAGGAYVDPGSWSAIRAATSVLTFPNPRGPEPRLQEVSAALTAWYPVDAAAVSAQDPVTLRAGLRQLTAQSLTIGADTRARFGTEVVPVLASALSRSSASSATLAVAAVGPIAVSVALIVLAAGLIIRRRRGDLALLSARGAAPARLRGLLALEGAVLGVPAAVAATVLALMLVSGDAGPVPTILALAVGGVPAAALAASLRPQTVAGGRADLDAQVRGRWARLAELLVLLLAAVAVVTLVVRGVGDTAEGVDPLVVIAPLLATVALGLLAVRLHPLWLRAALSAAQRRRGVVGLVGAARSLRDPAAGTTAVLAMLVAVSIAVFSSLVLATVDRGAVTAAERAVGADVSLSGPFVDVAALDAMRAVDGVAAVAGVAVSDRVRVAGTKGTVAATLIVTEASRLQEVQSGLAEGFDASALTPGAAPPEALVSADVAAQTGLGSATEPFTGVDVTGVTSTIPGVSAGGDVIVMDHADYADATGFGFFPRTVLIDVADGADVHAVRDAVSAIVTDPHTTQVLADRTAAIQSSPAVSALRSALLLAIALAVALSLVAILLVAGVSRDARSRVVALLRTLGLHRAGARGIVAWEFAPLGLSALVGGLVLGLALPLLVLACIDLRPFTGGVRQPGLTVDPLLTVGLVVAVVAALAVAVVGGVLAARTTSIVTVLRTEEDR